MKKYLLFCVLMTGFIFAAGGAAFGSGLETNGIGARGRSMGFAMVGMGDDWTVVHYNPAGAAMIEGSVFGGEYEFFTGGMKSTESLRNLPSGAGDPWRSDFTDPTGGAEPSSFNKKSIGSSIHFGALGFVQSAEKFSWGIGLYGSGSGTEWEDKISSGPDTINARISYTNGSANIPVVLAWRINPELAVGITLGLHWGMLTTENSKIRSGAGFPYVMDTTQDTEGTALGIELGLMWKPQNDFSLGAVIKLPYTFRKKGKTEIEQSLMALTATTDTTVDMEYPLRIALGAAWNATERDLLGFGLTWLNWGRFRMAIDYKNEIPFVLEDFRNNPARWQNTIRLNVGYERILNDKWDFRCGLAYDQAPEPDEYRTLVGGQVIDAWLLTVGAGVELDSVDINFGYIYTYGPPVEGFIPDAKYSMNLHELFVGIVKTF